MFHWFGELVCYFDISEFYERLRKSVLSQAKLEVIKKRRKNQERAWLLTGNLGTQEFGDQNPLQVLYSHDQLYKHICMQNHNDNTIKMSDTVL